jgi:hypothetical protein
LPPETLTHLQRFCGLKASRASFSLGRTYDQGRKGRNQTLSFIDDGPDSDLLSFLLKGSLNAWKGYQTYQLRREQKERTARLESELKKEREESNARLKKEREESEARQREMDEKLEALNRQNRFILLSLTAFGFIVIVWFTFSRVDMSALIDGVVSEAELLVRSAWIYISDLPGETTKDDSSKSAIAGVGRSGIVSAFVPLFWADTGERNFGAQVEPKAKIGEPSRSSPIVPASVPNHARGFALDSSAIRSAFVPMSWMNADNAQERRQ